MSAEILRVPRPRVLSIQRVQPGRFSVGDAALVRFAPGLLHLLNLRNSRGERIGDSYAPEWTVSLGAASTAAAAASQEQWGWTGVSLSVDWVRACEEDEYLLAKSVIESVIAGRFGKTSLVHSYEVVSEKSGDVLASGKMVLASSHPEAIERSMAASSPYMNSVKPAPPAIQAEAPEDESEALFRLERPSLLGKSVASDARLTAGDSWEWSFPASLLRMMMNPIGGGTEPVARRAHPLGFVSLAAAIHAAAQLFRGARPAHADVRWLRLAQGRSDFRLICKLKSFDNSRIFLESIFLKADAELAQVKLTLDRQPGESAGLVLTDEGEQPD